jgi:hypothetical protein
MTRRVLPAVLLPLFVTGVTVAGVLWNRSAGRGPIVLTDRELPLRFASDENTGRSVSIRYEDAWWSRDAWLNREKLASLGFDTTVDPASPDAEAHYGRALRRTVYVALELDGPAWQAWARRYQENTKQWNPEPDNARVLNESSRLVAVDAATDATVLEARYPNPQTHLITRGVVHLMIDRPQGGRPQLAGVVEQIAPRALYVPRHLAERLGSKPYRVTVRYGRRYEPWIVGVEP